MKDLIFRGSTVETTAPATWTEWDHRPNGDSNSLTVCLLATDKDERESFKLVAFHTPTGNEHMLTEVPHREDCCIACLKGSCKK